MKHLNLTHTLHILPWGIIKPLGLIAAALALIALAGFTAYAWVTLRNEPRS
jgi:hypothetical protein